MQKQRFGAKSPFDYDDKRDQLWDWVAECGTGIMHQCGDPAPQQCLDFCLTQYHRFNVPLPECIHEIIGASAATSLHYIDVVDPYVMFRGLSDVDIVDDSYLYAFTIHENGDKVYEPSPEVMETFQVIHGQSEEVFNSIMSHPGLDALPIGIGRELRGLLNGTHDYAYYMEVPAWDQISTGASMELGRLCTDADNILSHTKFEAYFELGAWAAFAWFIGPPSREFRANHHDIMATALVYGECILVDGCVISPNRYRKHVRPPVSCYQCGVAAWCVEVTMTMGSTNYMCEACLTDGMPKTGALATCGSKYCLLAECPHNPYHNLGAAGINRSRAASGQLAAMARGESIIRVIENPLQLKG